MNLANKFNIPVISFIDTPGAYPGIGAEQRGQAEAIANSIECCMSLKVPIISIIIGEGGSGGAIALASANKVMMLENAIYSVISPEGCASILWRNPGKALEAAKAMKLTANELFKMNIIENFSLEEFNINNSFFKIYYYGNPKKLKAELQKFGYQLKNDQGSWQIYLNE